MFKEKTDKLEIMCSDRVKYNQQIFKDPSETSKVEKIK